MFYVGFLNHRFFISVAVKLLNFVDVIYLDRDNGMSSWLDVVVVESISHAQHLNLHHRCSLDIY